MRNHDRFGDADFTNGFEKERLESGYNTYTPKYLETRRDNDLVLSLDIHNTPESASQYFLSRRLISFHQLQNKPRYNIQLS